MSFLMSFQKSIMDEDFLDDGVDNLHRQYMVVFLLIIDVFLGIKQFVGDPIECFVPKDLSGQQEKYVNAYCWTSSTYQLIDRDYTAFRGFQDTDTLIVRPEDRARNVMANQDNFANTHLSGEKMYISYYQWVPIIIALSAVLFYIPHVFWCSLTQNSGMYFKHIMYGAKGLAKIQSNPVSRKTMLADLVIQLNRWLAVTRKMSKKDSPKVPCVPEGRNCGCGTKQGNYLAYLYLAMKVAFLLNVFIQLYAMHAFLGNNILAHCFNIIESTIFSGKFIASKRFPIRTLCEFYGSPQVHGYLLSYTCHCVLPINLYNDKIFAVIAFLFLALGIITIISLMVWIFRIFYPQSMEKFIRHYLEVNNKLKSPEHSRLFRPFVEDHLRMDGCFIFKMMDRNLGNVVTDSIVVAIWDSYIEKCKEEGLMASSGTSTPKSKGAAADAKREVNCQDCGKLQSTPQGRECIQCGVILDV